MALGTLLLSQKMITKVCDWSPHGAERGWAAALTPQVCLKCLGLVAWFPQSPCIFQNVTY